MRIHPVSLVLHTEGDPPRVLMLNEKYLYKGRYRCGPPKSVESGSIYREGDCWVLPWVAPSNSGALELLLKRIRRLNPNIRHRMVDQETEGFDLLWYRNQEFSLHLDDQPRYTRAFCAVAEDTGETLEETSPNSNVFRNRSNLPPYTRWMRLDRVIPLEVEDEVYGAKGNERVLSATRIMYPVGKASKVILSDLYEIIRYVQGIGTLNPENGWGVEGLLGFMRNEALGKDSARSLSVSSDEDLTRMDPKLRGVFDELKARRARFKKSE